MSVAHYHINITSYLMTQLADIYIGIPSTIGIPLLISLRSHTKNTSILNFMFWYYVFGVSISVCCMRFELNNIKHFNTIREIFNLIFSNIYPGTNTFFNHLRNV